MGPGMAMTESTWFSQVRLARYAPAARMAVHAHDEPSLCLLVAGSYEERIRGRGDWHHPGQMMFCPVHEPHAQQFSADGALKLLVSPRAGALDFLRTRRLLEHAPFAGSPRLLAISRRMTVELASPDDGAARLMVESLLLEALGEFDRSAGLPARDEPWLARALEFVHAHACESFGLEAVARVVDRHPVHVARSFRAAYGMSVGAMTRTLRLARAARLLRETDCPIADIADECGFTDQAHLTRQFRAAYGLTPGRHRRAAPNPR